MAYTRVNWEDLPSTDTPINAANLNIMDEAIDDIYYESGNNANGNYIKFNDGTMFVWGTKTLTDLEITNTTTSGVYISAWQSGITYSQSFISTPHITQVFVQQVNNGVWLQPQQSSLSTSSTSGFYICSTASRTQDVTIGYFAIGKWK